ncbi:MAG TPA: hypothetical protein PLD25_21990 [Chloroflexota bacterium]|nr:hypothetical protein [Chloroflexota bacterium]HUM71822.1 hypothetical protein [Chloroflexota bacterium]
MNEKQQPDSQLFTIRVWQEKVDDQIQWRGKLRHVPSGEIRHFRGWAALIPLMLDMLRRHNDYNFVNSHQATGDEN